MIKYAEELGALRSVFKLLSIVGVLMFISHGTCCCDKTPETRMRTAV